MLKDSVEIGAQRYLPCHLACYLSHDALRGFVQHLIEGLEVGAVLLGFGILARVDLQILGVVELLRDLQNAVEMVEKLLGSLPVGFFDVLLVDLDDVGEAIDHELLEEGAVYDGIALRFDENSLERSQIFKLGDLQEGADVVAAELNDFELPT